MSEKHIPRPNVKLPQNKLSMMVIPVIRLEVVASTWADKRSSLYNNDYFCYSIYRQNWTLIQYIHVHTCAVLSLKRENLAASCHSSYVTSECLSKQRRHQGEIQAPVPSLPISPQQPKLRILSIEKCYPFHIPSKQSSCHFNAAFNKLKQ